MSDMNDSKKELTNEITIKSRLCKTFCVKLCRGAVKEAFERWHSNSLSGVRRRELHSKGPREDVLDAAELAGHFPFDFMESDTDWENYDKLYYASVMTEEQIDSWYTQQARAVVEMETLRFRQKLEKKYRKEYQNFKKGKYYKSLYGQLYDAYLSFADDEDLTYIDTIDGENTWLGY